MKSKIPASAAIILSALFFCISCAKIDTTGLGGDLIPAVDNVHTFDTLMDVITDNRMFADTTRMIYEEDHAVGIIADDPVFGGTVATLYSAFTPTSYKTYPFVNRDTVVIDSVVLSLSYTTLFGDSNSIEEFEVREIQPGYEFTDSLYYLNEADFPVTGGILGSAMVDFRTLNDSLQYRNGTDTVRTLNELRIKLDTSWARRFVDYDTSNAYNNDTMFRAGFKGLEVRASVASQVPKALAYFNLGDNQRTRITFYCRIQNSGKTDTIAPYFQYSFDPHANIVRRMPAHDYQATLSNSEDNDEKLYIQPAPGSYATIRIPNLQNMSNRVIHRAELIMERYPSDGDEDYVPPGLLFLDALNDVGDSVFTIRNDFALVNSEPGYDVSLIGGNLSNDKYIFNISRYVQSIVTNGYPSYTLRVHAPFTTRPYFIAPNTNSVAGRYGFVITSPVAKGRVVLYGGGSADPKRLRLRIIYSKI